MASTSTSPSANSTCWPCSPNTRPRCCRARNCSSWCGATTSPPTPTSSTCSSATCAASSKPTARPACCTPCAASVSCCDSSSRDPLMIVVSRIFRRTPSLRTRVAFATAIAAAIVVGIVGTVVWVGITQDRKERLDRRLDEAAGFAIPFLPRGLDEIPPSPNDQDAVITVRRADGQVTSNSVVLPELPPGYADTMVDGVRYRVRTVELSTPEPMSVAVGATYDATITDTNNLHRRVLIICTMAVGAATFG